MNDWAFKIRLFLPAWLYLLAGGGGATAFGGVNQWTTGGPPFPASQIVVAPTDPPTLYVGTGGGVFSSTDHGTTWIARSTGLPQGPILSIAVRPNGPTELLAGTSGHGVFRTTDGGENWEAANAGIESLSIGLLSMSSWGPAHATAYAVGNRVVGGSLYVSQDFGNSWTSTALDPQQDSITAIAADPGDPAHVYVGTGFCYSTLGCFGHLQMSTDSGQTWADPVTFDVVNQFAFDPASSSTVYAASGACGLWCSGGLRRSTDSGESWEAMPLAPGPYSGWIIRALSIDPADRDILYLAVEPYVTPGGVYVSRDAGATVFPFGEGLPGSPPGASLTALAIEPGGKDLHASTAALGVFDYEIGAVSSCTPGPQTLCLQNGRFQVQAQWIDFYSNYGLATVVPGATSDSSGLMWFFGPNNWELLIKVLDGCVVNGHYWVLGAAATNVAYTIQVTDTQTGTVKTYTNPLGTVSPAIIDTSAFEGCP